MARLSLKNDGFRKSRGGRSRWLLLRCEKCDHPIAVYQKDGPGVLKRLYCDRILAPERVRSRQNLVCGDCKMLLGVPIVYAKEDRPAFRLFAGAVTKELLRSDALASATKLIGGGA